jgi:vacuolar-type H+-ATPase subunit E/Vma4
MKGDPSSLLDKIIEDMMGEYSSFLEKAYEDASSLLESGYQSVKKDLEKSLKELYERNMYSIKSYEESRKAEIRLELQRIERKYIDEVMKEFKDRIAKLSEKEREKILGSLLNHLVNTKKITEGTLHILKRDKEIVRNIVKNYPVKLRFKIKTDLDSRLGGFKLDLEKEGVVYDYTLELILENLSHRLYSIASEELYGSE